MGRAQESDGGEGDLSREREIVSWVARLGAVSVEQIGRRFEVGRSVAYEQVRRLVEFGLLERTQTAIGDPTLISATQLRHHLRRPWPEAADDPDRRGRPLARHAPTSRSSSSAATAPSSVLTERELRFDAKLTGKPIGAAKLGETLNGHRRLHWPDLAVRTDQGLIVYEVELTPKSRRRARVDRQGLAACPTRSSGASTSVAPSSPTQQVVDRSDQQGGCGGSGVRGRVAAGGAMSTTPRGGRRMQRRHRRLSASPRSSRRRDVAATAPERPTDRRDSAVGSDTIGGSRGSRHGPYELQEVRPAAGADRPSRQAASHPGRAS